MSDEPREDAVVLRQQLNDIDVALGYGYFPSDGTGRVGAIHERSYTNGFADAAKIATATLNDLIAQIRALCRYDWEGEPMTDGHVLVAEQVDEVLDAAEKAMLDS